MCMCVSASAYNTTHRHTVSDAEQMDELCSCRKCIAHKMALIFVCLLLLHPQTVSHSSSLHQSPSYVVEANSIGHFYARYIHIKVKVVVAGFSLLFGLHFAAVHFACMHVKILTVCGLYSLYE